MKKEASAAKKPAAEKKAPAVKKPAEVEANVVLQFNGNDYTKERLLQSAKDVWQFDQGRDLADLKKVEIFVKPEEGKAYVLANGEESYSFNILTASTSDDGRSAGRMQVLPDNGIQIRSAAFIVRRQRVYRTQFSNYLQLAH